MFRKKSRSRVRHHRAQWKKITAPELIRCPACGELKPPHVVCPACGRYNGRQVTG
ncbi:50S ribosomal protein L32 [Amycolatopsis suaedae]|uniref:Large ribosomal subunit protein bL32 n=2 Tax=Amycolatopsis suaedae TaxID=2510978 RepID=A0A4Q7JFF1_9PSEU|nr:50S ribosomal protein L32 [Amycolatopsis suaedae]RZQ66118.1 50S ribosomal protein L32 [Amycolatopsis suaedae]